jgi:LysR family nitrogen assimilation transcriptional regulator
MRIRQLQSFVTVCTTGSITGAARILNIAQPALGVQIRGLEDELGVMLLHRRADGVTPTAEGELLLREALEIIERIEGLKRRFNNVQGRSISIGLPMSLMAPLSGPILNHLKRVGAGAEIHLSEGPSHALLERVEKGELDLALAFGENDSGKLFSEGHFVENLYLTASRNSPAKHGEPVSFDELSRTPLVLPDEKNFISQLVHSAATRGGLELKILYRIDSMSGVKNVVRQGLAQAILPWSTIEAEVEAGEFIARPLSDPPLTRTLHIWRPIGAPAAVVTKSVLTCLRKNIREYYDNQKGGLAPP